MTDVSLPRSLPELWSLMESEPRARLYAGGTDLLVEMRSGDSDAPCFICLERLPELQGVRRDNGFLWIGACTTHARLLRDPLIGEHLPVLAKALRTLGSPLIRTIGTIGGNICTASPAGDSLPPLYVLEAEVELRSGEAVRRMPIREFVTGPGQTQLRKGEILSGIRVKPPEGTHIHHFEKVGQRKALACAIASMAGLLRVSSSGIVESARLAWGSVGPTIVRSAEAEAALVGMPLSLAVLRKAAELVRKAVSPIDDVRGGADYRRQVSGNLLLRLAPAEEVTRPAGPSCR